MGKTGESLRELLAQAATVLGLKPSEARKIELIQQQLRAEKARYNDRLDDHKDEIRRLESIAMRKKREMDSARGETKRLIAREIEQLLRERNGLREKSSLWFSRIEKISLLQRKLELAAEVEAAEKMDIEEMADIAVDRMEELIDIEKASDKATEQLEKVKYEEPRREKIDVMGEMGAVEGSADESLLSDDAMKDLAELEGLEEPEPE
jgi:hypothetical protein